MIALHSDHRVELDLLKIIDNNFNLTHDHLKNKHVQLLLNLYLQC